ncbi:MAG: hypothetical protein J3R72DRAFT_529224 [Linnemannia gamsii]|nr:MAG: hypothetical protein J3R72DRAFT_529224 [Linnemannia gamsii]
MTQPPTDVDVIAPHSDSLCLQFNQDHSTIVLNIARFFIESKDAATINTNTKKVHVVSARVVQVRQGGLLLEGQTIRGQHFKLSVAFSGGSVKSLAMAKESFLKLGKKADRGMLRTCPRPIPGQPTGLGVYWPRWTPFLITLAASVSSFFYVYFFPDTKIPPFLWIKNYFGYDTVTSCVYFAVFLHAFQTSTAIYLMRRVSAYKFSWKQMMIWMGCVQFMGIGSMLKLLPIVYESRFVAEENVRIEREEAYYLEECAEEYDIEE